MGIAEEHSYVVLLPLAANIVQQHSNPASVGETLDCDTLVRRYIKISSFLLEPILQISLTNTTHRYY